MGIAEIHAAVMSLSLTHYNLTSVIAIAQEFTDAMDKQGDVFGADDVLSRLVDAFSACDDVRAITLEDRDGIARANSTSGPR